MREAKDTRKQPVPHIRRHLLCREHSHDLLISTPLAKHKSFFLSDINEVTQDTKKQYFFLFYFPLELVAHERCLVSLSLKYNLNIIWIHVSLWVFFPEPYWLAAFYVSLVHCDLKALSGFASLFGLYLILQWKNHHLLIVLRVLPSTVRPCSTQWFLKD